jgi:hypothetical protein
MDVSTRQKRRIQLRELHGAVFLVVVFILLIVAGFWAFDGWQVVQTFHTDQASPPARD